MKQRLFDTVVYLCGFVVSYLPQKLSSRCRNVKVSRDFSTLRQKIIEIRRFLAVMLKFCLILLNYGKTFVRFFINGAKHHTTVSKNVGFM